MYTYIHAGWWARNHFQNVYKYAFAWYYMHTHIQESTQIYIHTYSYIQICLQADGRAISFNPIITNTTRQSFVRFAHTWIELCVYRLHIYTYGCMNIYIWNTYTSIYVLILYQVIHIYIDLYFYMYICTHIYTCIYVHIFMNVYIHIYIYMYMCI